MIIKGDMLMVCRKLTLNFKKSILFLVLLLCVVEKGSDYPQFYGVWVIRHVFIVNRKWRCVPGVLWVWWAREESYLLTGLIVANPDTGTESMFGMCTCSTPGIFRKYGHTSSVTRVKSQMLIWRRTSEAMLLELTIYPPCHLSDISL